MLDSQIISPTEPSELNFEYRSRGGRCFQLGFDFTPLELLFTLLEHVPGKQIFGKLFKFQADLWHDRSTV